MCQLLGLSSRAPVRMSLSWERFASRGSDELGNPDGWGVAYAGDGDVQLVREPTPAADSELVRFLGRHGPPATTVISHVRRATAGARELVNTQPFSRVLGGRRHVFAHNGHVGGLRAPGNPWLQPVGTTDSELLFANLLERMLDAWASGEVPPLELRTEIVAGFAAEMRERGAANFLYFDGVTLFAHAHRRTIPGDGISDDPGLHLLLCPDERRGDGIGACDGLGCIGPDTTRALVATRPLDAQGWQPLAAGTLLRIESGGLVE